jgi:hypothetical protein
MRLNRGQNQLNQYGYRGNKKPKHTHTFQKARVVVTLYDGSQFTDNYLRIEGRNHLFKDKGRVKSSTIFQMTLLSKSTELQRKIEEIEKGKSTWVRSSTLKNT